MLNTSARLALATALAALGMWTGAAAAEVRVLSTIALQSAMEELVPAFNRSGGESASAEYAITGVLARRLQEGEAADVFVGTRSAIDELVKAGKVQAGSVVDLANSSVGVAVKKGAPKPDISSADALKRTLLNSKGISYTNPDTGGVSGVHFAKVIEKLGIAEQMKSRTHFPPGSGFAAQFLINGQADLAVQQNAELLSVPGVELLGPLPPEFRNTTLFSAAIPSTSKQPDAGKALIRFLQSPAAAKVMKAKGLEPLAK